MTTGRLLPRQAGPDRPHGVGIERAHLDRFWPAATSAEATVTLWRTVFHGDTARLRRTGHRRLVLDILGHALGVSPDDVVLHRPPHGKPELVAPVTPFGDDKPLHFNVSHSGPHLVVATTTSGPVGVDVEEDRPVDWTLLAPAVLHSRELRAVHAMVPHQRASALLRVWTRKEALLKADGVGLRQPPASVEVDPQAREGGTEPLRHTGGARWHLYDAGATTGLHLCVATSAPVSVRHVVWLDGPTVVGPGGT